MFSIPFDSAKDNSDSGLEDGNRSQKGRALNMTYTLNTQNCTAVFDAQTGALQTLTDAENPQCSWVAKDGRFGVPFLSSSQRQTNFFPIALEKDGEALCGKSHSGVSAIRWQAQQGSLCAEYRGSTMAGPRSGVELDFNFLDLPGDTPWRSQCMPYILYTDPRRQYAYFVFSTADERYLTLCVEAPFAAWRILYSEAGHRMVGFQLLSQADDVRTPDGIQLAPVESLRFSLTPCKTPAECWNTISRRLGIAPVLFEVTGAPVGGSVTFSPVGVPEEVKVLAPDKSCRKLAPEQRSLTLRQPGIYELQSRTGERVHTSRVLCHEGWRTVYDKVNRFYRDHFQDESGAFYRVIWRDTLSPKGGYTMEGLPFGDIHTPYSCRTGEFGGFAGWAMIKNALLFGAQEDLTPSIERYLLNWALNRGHEDSPYLGSACRRPQKYLGREYGPWHLYHEVNYPQHEAFLLEQMLDYYAVYADESILWDACALGEHFVAEHMDPDGTVICQNEPDGHRVDYCTVHVPIAPLILLSDCLETKDAGKAQYFRDAAVRLADRVCARGFDFPTEGEPCTEDGSMACSALTLLLAYTRLEKKPEYLNTAREILRAHDVLTLSGADCRMNGSSTRFWETQYESQDWGPSINAGHAWTLWMAQAKALLAGIDGDYDLLREAYNGFVTNLSKVEPSGGMPSCFTPDLIPGTPHPPQVYGVSGTAGESMPDLHLTTSVYAGRYVPGTYACSGNYLLIAAQPTFARMSGLSFVKNQAVNGIFGENRFTSAAPRLETLILQGLPAQPVQLCLQGVRNLELILGSQEQAQQLGVSGARTVNKKGRAVRLSLAPGAGEQTVTLWANTAGGVMGEE